METPSTILLEFVNTVIVFFSVLIWYFLSQVAAQVLKVKLKQFYFWFTSVQCKVASADIKPAVTPALITIPSCICPCTCGYFPPLSHSRDSLSEGSYSTHCSDGNHGNYTDGNHGNYVGQCNTSYSEQCNGLNTYTNEEFREVYNNSYTAPDNNSHDNNSHDNGSHDNGNHDNGSHDNSSHDNSSHDNISHDNHDNNTNDDQLSDIPAMTVFDVNGDVDYSTSPSPFYGIPVITITPASLGEHGKHSNHGNQSAISIETVVQYDSGNGSSSDVPSPGPSPAPKSHTSYHGYQGNTTRRPHSSLDASGNVEYIHPGKTRLSRSMSDLSSKSCPTKHAQFNGIHHDLFEGDSVML